MDKTDKVRAWLAARVGNPYIMGGTGAFCTVSYRKARAAQYPGSAANIKKYCPRLNGSANSCQGCKNWDEVTGAGKQAYDCAQLVRYAMQQAGIKMVSGATSQWNKTDWAQQGEMDTLPQDRLCILYRYDGANVFGHTGIYLGNGWFQHAKGHRDGVKVEKMEDGRWTHWGIPVGLYEESEPETEGKTEMYEVTGKNLALRKGMSKNAAVLLRIPTGTLVEGVQTVSDWVQVTYEGQTGYCMAEYLRNVTPPDAADDEEAAEPEKKPAEGLVTVPMYLDVETARSLQAALNKGLEEALKGE
jgi:hypothetical protein